MSAVLSPSVIAGALRRAGLSCVSDGTSSWAERGYTVRGYRRVKRGNVVSGEWDSVAVILQAGKGNDDLEAMRAAVAATLTDAGWVVEFRNHSGLSVKEAK